MVASFGEQPDNASGRLAEICPVSRRIDVRMMCVASVEQAQALNSNLN